MGATWPTCRDPISEAADRMLDRLKEHIRSEWPRNNAPIDVIDVKQSEQGEPEVALRLVNDEPAEALQGIQEVADEATSLHYKKGIIRVSTRGREIVISFHASRSSVKPFARLRAIEVEASGGSSLGGILGAESLQRLLKEAVGNQPTGGGAQETLYPEPGLQPRPIEGTQKVYPRYLLALTAIGLGLLAVGFVAALSLFFVEGGFALLGAVPPLLLAIGVLVLERAAALARTT